MQRPRLAFPMRLLNAAVALSLLAPVSAAAAERPRWELGVGGVFYTQPDYIGSDEYRFHPIPFPWIVYRGERLRMDRESIQTRIFGTELVRLDVSASGQIAVDSDDNDLRHGMPDRDWILQLGPALEFPVTQSDDGEHTLEVSVPVRAAIGFDWDDVDYQGFVSSPKLEYRYEPENWRFEANAGLEFGSNEYYEFYYGVAPKFVTASRPFYGAESGYGGVRLAAGLSRYFGRFYVGVFTRYHWLEGATFEDSPLVGSEHAFVGGVAVGFVLMQSKDMVPVGAAANLAARGEPAAAPDAAQGE